MHRAWNRRKRLFLGHTGMQALDPLVSRLFDKGDVLGKMLLSIDLSFLSPFLLIEPELRNDGPVLLIEFFPDLTTTCLLG